MSSYVEMLMLSLFALFGSAFAAIGAGLLDIRAGYDSLWKPLCAILVVLTGVIATWVFWLLIPYATVLLIACFVTGVILAAGGFLRVVWSKIT